MLIVSQAVPMSFWYRMLLDNMEPVTSDQYLWDLPSRIRARCSSSLLNFRKMKMCCGNVEMLLRLTHCNMVQHRLFCCMRQCHSWPKFIHTPLSRTFQYARCSHAPIFDWRNLQPNPTEGLPFLFVVFMVLVVANGHYFENRLLLKQGMNGGASKADD